MINKIIKIINLHQLAIAISIILFPINPVFALNQNLKLLDDFENLCLSQDRVDLETKKTINLLLQIAQTQNCKTADTILSETPQLNLSGYQLKDLSPLQSFNQLKILHLSGNKISNLTPLSTLKQLKFLVLDVNQI
ncbi:MAG: hypothetical protein ACKPEZ_29585, partial [Planktothrix sp.]